MITTHRLNGKAIVINAELIRSIESNPDTTILLVNGDRIIVTETMPEVIAKTIEYGRHLRQVAPPT